MRRSGVGVAGSGGGGGFVVDTPLIIRLAGLAVLVITLWAFVLPLPDHETHLVRRRSVSLRIRPNKEGISTSSRWVQSTEGRDASGNLSKIDHRFVIRHCTIDSYYNVTVDYEKFKK